MDFLSSILHPPPERSIAYIIGASVVTTYAVLTVSRLAFQGKQEKIIRSPRATLLPKISKAEIAALPYVPDVLPGGRDVDSPYGTIKVYEWGPEEGRKVLLIHGITTPCVALGAVARALVEKGCRVMLFDLWGRGYSDSCADLEHDDRLYATEILLAITSSPLSWTGSGSHGGFSIIGYSLGGGIAANFTSSFPSMVNSLVLLAPAGIIRSKHMSSRSRLIYSIGIIPESLLKWSVKRRLQSGPMYKDENKKEGGAHVRDAVGAEVKGDALTGKGNPPPPTSTTYPPLSLTQPDLTVEQTLAWQLDNHAGFVHSFMSSVRFAPITAQHDKWAKLAQRPGKVLLVAASRDPIILADEVREDAERLLGTEKLEFRVVEAAHDFPITDSPEVVGFICEFWGL